jgi:hypothetical protein
MKRVLVFSFWLAGLGIFVHSFLNFEMPHSEGAPIGHVGKHQGNVSLRSGSLGVWKTVENGQTLFDGTSISTGNSSQTELELLDGRKLKLGANSQVTLNAGDNSAKPDFLVRVVAGQVGVVAEKNPPSGGLTGKLLGREFFGLAEKRNTKIIVGEKVLDLNRMEQQKKNSVTDPKLAVGKNQDTIAKSALSADLDAEVTLSAEGIEVKGEGAKLTDVSADKSISESNLSSAGLLGSKVTGGNRGENSSGVASQGTNLEGGNEKNEEDDLPEAEFALSEDVLQLNWREDKDLEELLPKIERSGASSRSVYWHARSIRAGRVTPLKIEFSFPAEFEKTVAARGIHIRIRNDKDPSSAQAIVEKSCKVEKVRIVCELVSGEIKVIQQAMARWSKMRGLFPLYYSLGYEGKSAFHPSMRPLMIASATDMVGTGGRVLLDSSTWKAIRNQLIQLTTSPSASSMFNKADWISPASSTEEYYLTQTNEPKWAAFIDVPRVADLEKLLALLPKDAVFDVHEREQKKSPGQAAIFTLGDSVLLSVFTPQGSGIETLSISEEVLKGGMVLTDSKISWVGDPLDILPAKVFLSALQNPAASESISLMNRWRTASFGFRVLGEKSFEPKLISWAVARNHPQFAKTFLSKSVLFLRENAPSVYAISGEL